MSSGDQQVDPELVEALRKKVKNLEERVSELESSSGEGATTSHSSGWGDRRDQAVISKLEVGESYQGAFLRKLYKLETDIKNKGTLKNRVGELKNSGLFEYEGYSSYRYVGDGDG